MRLVDKVQQSPRAGQVRRERARKRDLQRLRQHQPRRDDAGGDGRGQRALLRLPRHTRRDRIHPAAGTHPAQPRQQRRISQIRLPRDPQRARLPGGLQRRRGDRTAAAHRQDAGRRARRRRLRLRGDDLLRQGGRAAHRLYQLPEDTRTRAPRRRRSADKAPDRPGKRRGGGLR